LGRAAPPRVLTAEAREFFLYEYRPRPGDTVFDVGAGIGAGALLFSHLVGDSGRVVSLEAHPRTYERLAALCKANRLENVTTLQVAAADMDGQIVISDADHYLQNTVFGIEDGGIQVPAHRIDTIAARMGITKIDLLTMNIEGAERLAIEGLDGIIDGTRHVCISCHDFLADVGGADELRTKAEIREFLIDHGFRVVSRDDAPDSWTRDYLYGAKTR
jgi:FkbM family methyltransferase